MSIVPLIPGLTPAPGVDIGATWTNLDGRVTTLESTSTSHTATLSSHTSSLTALDGRLDVLEGEQPEILRTVAWCQGEVDVRDYFAVGYTDTQAFEAAVVAALAASKNLRVSRKDDGSYTYTLTHGIIINGAVGMTISCEQGVKLQFPSSDTSIDETEVVDGEPIYRNLTAFARGALVLKNCSDCTVRSVVGDGDVYNAGDPNTYSVLENVGVLVGMYKCTRTQILFPRVKYAPLCHQTNEAEDTGTSVIGAYSYGARNSVRLGSESMFQSCHFELPTDSHYDRVGNDGSSHAIYFFAASGSYCKVLDCHFKNIRVDGIKVSGSASPIICFEFADCSFRRVGLKGNGETNGGGGIVVGADDINEHNSISIKNCKFYDCNSAISVLGSRATVIDGVEIWVTAAPVTAAITSYISISRYADGQEPCSTVMVSNVLIAADPALSVVSLASYGISIAYVGDDALDKQSTVILSNIMVDNAAGAVISSTQCVAPIFDNVTGIGCTTLMALNGDLRPWIKSASIVGQTSNSAAIRMTNVSWPIFGDMLGCGQIRSTAAANKCRTGDNAGGSTAVEFPLAGTSGFCLPSDGQSEIVFSWGAGHQRGAYLIGRCSNDPGDTNGSITLTTAGHDANCAVGYTFFASPNADGTSPRTGTGTVATSAAGVVTFTGTITGITTNDYLFRTHTAVGRNNASAEPADTNGTITFLSATSAKSWRVGDYLNAGPNSNGSGLRSGIGRVTAIDRALGTMTFSGTITGITVNDYIFPAADRLDWNGTTLTYCAAAVPVATTDFSSIATLNTAIAALGGGAVYTAADYGSTLASAVTTAHIRVRRAGGAAYYARSYCKTSTALVLLHNYAVGMDRCDARGGTAGDIVVWSVAAKSHRPPVLTPNNAVAQTAMTTSYPLRIAVDSADDESNCTLRSTGVGATAEFSWRA